jgi:nucleoside 2-deoxyribosyltransferase
MDTLANRAKSQLSISEAPQVFRDIKIAPCLDCGSTDIRLFEGDSDGHGGGECLSCHRNIFGQIKDDPSFIELAEIWNLANDKAEQVKYHQRQADHEHRTANRLLHRIANKPRIYLAGFDVFRRDAISHGEYLKALCVAQGMVGMYPFDNALPEGVEGPEAAKLISQMNMGMVRSATAILVNLNCFRGREPDSGTVFEFGMAVALGKPVWGYFEETGTLREQIAHDADGYDEQGYQVENFGLPRNLMLACTWAGASVTAEDAVIALKQHLENL